ncbi:MAG: enoyl-CoA hydratase/isomerase family protein [Streptosporangiaceae bacterium]
MDGVSVKRHDHVAEIVLDRPDALNALSTSMAERLARVCEEVARESRVRAVVLSGAGERAFCVGADLKERGGFSDADMLRQRGVFRAAFGGVLNLPQPTIAAVHGYALGGGCEFALSCDLIVADETAVFGLPETSVGLVPGGGGTQLALRRLGPSAAADLIFTARRLRIDEAEGLGLVNRRVAAGRAAEETCALAESVAANSPTGVRAAKRALRQGAGVALAVGLEVEDSAWRTAAFSADRREGIAAFNEKRPPAWPGD